MQETNRIVVGTILMRFCSRGERLDSTLNTTKKNGNL